MCECLNNFSHLFVNACHGKFIFDLVEFLFDLDWYTTFLLPATSWFTVYTKNVMIFKKLCIERRIYTRK